MAALKTAVVTGLTAPHSRGFNCQSDGNTLLTDFHNQVFKNDPTNEMDTSEPSGDAVVNADSDDDTPVLSLPEVDTLFEVNLADTCNQPVVYISGYLAARILKDLKCQTCKESLTIADPEKMIHTMYSYIRLREWWPNKTSLTYPSENLCHLVKQATDLVETEICPILYRHHIFHLTVTLFTAKCDIAWYSCVIHKTVIFDKIFATLAQLLIRRQCHRLNQGLALQEETLADAVKMAQQQGRAK